MGKGNKQYGAFQRRKLTSISHWLLLGTSVTTNKESYICAYMKNKEK